MRQIRPDGPQKRLIIDQITGAPYRSLNDRGARALGAPGAVTFTYPRRFSVNHQIARERSTAGRTRCERQVPKIMNGTIGMAKLPRRA